ncbi:MAG TPA: DNA cytosine methyltransferase [Tepidisphaeraceae bacterium]|nr:DNA cytosine methyltransferase [Tepidisphaeraceae bacterium]
MNHLRAIDLCCGAGGWACAARGLPIRVELAVDLWPAAARTYALNHPETEVIVGDVRDPAIQDRVESAAVGVDLIVGGIPCEWLSSYRTLNPVKRPERDSERATLDAVLGLVRRIGPRFWCLEDVKGIVRELPILTPWQEVNSRGFSAQRRKRVFVGDFPVIAAGDDHRVLADCLRRGPFRIGRRSAHRNPVVQRSFTKTESLAAYPDRKAPTMAGLCSRRDAELLVVDPAIAGGKRQLEWQEAARLQGFPDDYVFFGSPTDVGLMVARAVQIDTGRAILERIVEVWQRTTDNGPLTKRKTAVAG